jgi:ABC-type nitrate/sulfonate/bicarbonate transport system substrate-binding protein
VLKLALLIRLIVAACLVPLASYPAVALEQVSMQLKGKHQFQFAGYYAALEQGFYRAAGLDVTIREGGPGTDVAETVASGKADFGACSASVLREWPVGRRLVVLAAIFQRSAAVILVARRADISSVSDLRGRTLMDTPGSDEIAAMLKREGVDYEALPRVVHQSNPRDLLPAGLTRWWLTAATSHSSLNSLAPPIAPSRPAIMESISTATICARPKRRSQPIRTGWRRSGRQA